MTGGSEQQEAVPGAGAGAGAGPRPPLDLDVDAVLAEAGDFHRYQHFLMLLFGVINVLSAFHYFGQIFIAITPEHWCRIPELQENETGEGGLWAPPQDPRCSRYDVDLSNVTSQAGGNASWGTRPCDGGWEYSLPHGYSSIVSELDWVCSDKWRPAAGLSLFFVGCSLGTLALGVLADNIGRLHVLVIANMLALAGNLGTSFVQTFPPYAVCRFIAGLATDSNFAMFYIIVLEYTRPSRRTLSLNLTIGVGYTVGCVAVPWVAALAGGWRLFLVAAAAPLAAVPALYLCLPESARWLLSKGRADKAVACFSRVAKFNGRRLRPDTVHAFTVSAKLPAQSATTPSVLGLFKTPNLRRKTCILIFKSMVLNLCYDAISRNVADTGLSPFAVFSAGSLTTLPACLIILWLQDRLGRKAMAAASLALTGLFNLAAGALLAARGGDDDTVLVLTLALVGRLGVNVAYNSGMQYAAELIPTEVRGQGVAAIHMAGYVVLFLSPYVLYTSNFWVAIPDLLLGGLSVLGALLCLLLPETLHRSLPVSLADGEAFGEGERMWEFAWTLKADGKRDVFSSVQQLVHN